MEFDCVIPDITEHGDDDADVNDQANDIVNDNMNDNINDQTAHVTTVQGRPRSGKWRGVKKKPTEQYENNLKTSSNNVDGSAER